MPNFSSPGREPVSVSHCMERAISKILALYSAAWAVSWPKFSYSLRRTRQTSKGIRIGHRPSIEVGSSDIWSSTMACIFRSLTTLPLWPTIRPKRVMMLLIRLPVAVASWTHRSRCANSTRRGG